MSELNFVSYPNAETLMTAIGTKLDALKGAYVIRGNSTFANLPSTLTLAMNGYVYNVTDEFTTDARFTVSGQKYPAGTNVVVINTGDETTPVMKLDVFAGFIDVDAIEGRIDATQNIIAPEFDESVAYAVGDVVIYDEVLYRFKAEHEAGAWNIAHVDATDVRTLIDNAEPDSLTTAQINALIALLD